MGKMTLRMKPTVGYGVLRFKNYSGEGQAETETGVEDVSYSQWDPNVQVTIKKALARKLKIPDTFRVTIEWD